MKKEEMSPIQRLSARAECLEKANKYKLSGLTKEETLALILLWNKKNEFIMPKKEIEETIDSSFGVINEDEINEFKVELKFQNDIKHSGINIKELKAEILQLITLRKVRKATELMTKEIEHKFHINSIRDDEKVEMWIYSEGIYIPQAKTFIKEFCREILGTVYTTHFANEVIAKIETDTYINAEDFYNKNYINEIPVLNGILNVITKELLEFTPKKIFFNKLPITYDVNKKCDNIIKHLRTVLKNEEDIPVMQELFGFLLYKEYKIEKAFMMTGTGRNGKGKTLSLMKSFIGADNCSNIAIQQFEKDLFSISELFSKMANLAGDLSPTALKNTGIFKELTGRDMISAPRKFLPRIKFVNYAKMIFCCNELPRTYDTSNAFWNRWILLEFPYTFVSQKELNKLKTELKPDELKMYKLADTEIIDKLTSIDELSGLLNWALIGLHRVLKQGDFSCSKSVNDVKTEWIRKSDSFTAFCMDFIVEDYAKAIYKNDLRKAYGLYCKKHKIKALGDKHINFVLSSLGVGESRLPNETHRVWEGIRFKTNKKEDKNQYLYQLTPELISTISGKQIKKEKITFELGGL